MPSFQESISPRCLNTLHSPLLTRVLPANRVLVPCEQGVTLLARVSKVVMLRLTTQPQQQQQPHGHLRKEQGAPNESSRRAGRHARAGPSRRGEEGRPRHPHRPRGAGGEHRGCRSPGTERRLAHYPHPPSSLASALAARRNLAAPHLTVASKLHLTSRPPHPAPRPAPHLTVRASFFRTEWQDGPYGSSSRR